MAIEQDARWQILTLGNEDFSILQEALGEMEAIAPHLSSEEWFTLADKTLRKLIADGLVQLRNRTLRSKPEEEHVFSDAEVDAVLSDRKNWEPPSAEEQWSVCIEATEAGAHAWRQPNPN